MGPLTADLRQCAWLGAETESARQYRGLAVPWSKDVGHIGGTSELDLRKKEPSWSLRSQRLALAWVPPAREEEGLGTEWPGQGQGWVQVAVVGAASLGNFGSCH